MPVCKVIPVMLVLFLIRKEREGRKKKMAIPVAVIRNHRDSQKKPANPRYTDGTLKEGNQDRGSQRNYQSAEMRGSTFSFS